MPLIVFSFSHGMLKGMTGGKDSHLPKCNIRSNVSIQDERLCQIIGEKTQF